MKIFYKQLFHTRVFCAAFICLQFGSLFFGEKENRAGAASKMLVKLTTERHFNVEERRCKFDKRRPTRDDV